MLIRCDVNQPTISKPTTPSPFSGTTVRFDCLPCGYPAGGEHENAPASVFILSPVSPRNNDIKVLFLACFPCRLRNGLWLSLCSIIVPLHHFSTTWLTLRGRAQASPALTLRCLCVASLSLKRCKRHNPGTHKAQRRRPEQPCLDARHEENDAKCWGYLTYLKQTGCMLPVLLWTKYFIHCSVDTRVPGRPPSPKDSPVWTRHQLSWLRYFVALSLYSKMMLQIKCLSPPPSKFLWSRHSKQSFPSFVAIDLIILETETVPLNNLRTNHLIPSMFMLTSPCVFFVGCMKTRKKSVKTKIKL